MSGADAPPLTLDRREAIGLAAGLMMTAAAGSAAGPADATASAPSDRLRLWYRQPARMWLEALPIGNGRLGAMVHGGIHEEILQLNCDTWWAGRPYDPVNPAARAALAEVRALVFAGKYAEAQARADRDLLARPTSQMPYQTAGILSIAHRDIYDNDAETYERELDLDSATATTSYAAHDVHFRREIFATAVDNVVAVRFSADRRGALNLKIGWRPDHAGSIQPGGDDALLLVLHNQASAGIDGGLTLAAQARIQLTGGVVAREGDALIVSHADAMVVLVSLATDYRRFDLVGGDPAAETGATLAKAAAKGYAALRADHLADHRRLFRAVSLDLGSSPQAALSTDARIAISAPAEDPALASLYFAFARYLMIASSRPGSQAANLQGRWNDSDAPAWGSKYTININTQMNYWLAEPTNLGECTAPLIAMVEDLAVTGARTAKAMYGARGWVAHHNTDVWRASAPIDFAASGMWPTGGAWLCLHLWDHYDYGRDRRFLERAWPTMRNAALFFLDTLVPYPGSEWLVTNPSVSPENDHGHGGNLCAGPTMDMQILRDLFGRVIDAGAILKRDAALCGQFAAARARLVPSRVGRAGQLMEWVEDWDMTAPDLHHRHISHLFGLHPSHQIDRDGTPALAAAARRTLEIRGDASTGWGLAWRANFWARLGDGDHAHRVLMTLLSSQRTYPNMFDAHPPFQIDGNFGGANAIVEMLVLSRAGSIVLLPALPRAWPRGRITGIRIRGGAELDLAWADGALTECIIRPRVGSELTVSCGTARRTVALRPARPVRLTGAGLDLTPA